jgi:hypothetical protein
MSERRCENCEFARPRKDNPAVVPAFQCVRFPPIHTVREDSERTSQDGWPYVTFDDWCGEFKPRPSTTGKAEQ